MKKISTLKKNYIDQLKAAKDVLSEKDIKPFKDFLKQVKQILENIKAEKTLSDKGKDLLIREKSTFVFSG